MDINLNPTIQLENPKVTPRKNLVNLLLLLASVVTLIMVAVVGYILIHRAGYKSDNTPSTQNSGFIPSLNPSPFISSPSASIITNATPGTVDKWRTLTNQQDGYQIRYPDNWYDAGQLESMDGFYMHALANEKGDLTKLSPNGMYIIIRKWTKTLVYGDNQRLTPVQYFNEYKKLWYDAKRLSIDGQPALYKVIIGQRTPGEREKLIYIPQYMILDKNKFLYEIIYSSQNYELAQTSEKLFNQIVNTIKFTH